MQTDNGRMKTCWIAVANDKRVSVRPKKNAQNKNKRNECGRNEKKQYTARIMANQTQ